MSFSERQKILKCLWCKFLSCIKCGHTEKSNYGLNLSFTLMFLTIYGVGKSQYNMVPWGNTKNKWVHHVIRYEKQKTIIYEKQKNNNILMQDGAY